jgi:hypothetical protein
MQMVGRGTVNVSATARIRPAAVVSLACAARGRPRAWRRICAQRWTMSCLRTRRRPLAPAATVINAACSFLAMAAQVVQEAPGGGDGGGRAVDGLGGGAGRGSLYAGYDRDGVGD